MSYPIEPEQSVLDWIRANLHADPIKGLVYGYLNGLVGSEKTAEGYVKIYCGTVTYQKRSNIIWYLVHGIWPTLELDHENRIRTDDRLGNLIPKTTRENSYNRRHCLNRDLPRGIYKHRQAKDRYAAKIMYDYKQIGLGMFASPEEAYEARLDAEMLIAQGIRFENTATFKAARINLRQQLMAV